MKHCFFRSFDVGAGDCNVIRLVDGDEQYAIMVDCGRMTAAVKDYVETVLHKHINLLVATHIDGDHIVGLAKMLKDIPNLQIDRIWYNCYQRKDDVERVALTERQKQILEWIKGELPVEFDAINYRREISAPQAKSLAKIILENEAFRSVWNTDYITNETAIFDLPGTFGRIVFLSPDKEALPKVEALMKDAFNKYFMQIWDESLSNQEEIHELLLRLVEAYKSRYEQRTIAADQAVRDMAFVEKQARMEDVDDSLTNAASIAFMLECGEHRLLMLGDAHSDVVARQLDQKYKDAGFPLVCDAVKVAHHGSNGNSGRDLMSLIACNRYFIPGGKGDKYPAWGTFGRIGLNSKGRDRKTIVFSHCCDMTQAMCSLDEGVKNALNIETVISEQEYELFEW